MSSEELMQSQQTGIHRMLSQLEGEWEGTTRTWFMPDELADEQPQRGSMRLVLDGRFVLHEYETTLQGYACRGIAFYGYNLQKGQFEAAWIDSCHNDTAIMFSSAESNNTPFSVLGHYPDPGGGPSWGWRTEIIRHGPDRVTITYYNITPEGDASKGVETEYYRKQVSASAIGDE